MTHAHQENDLTLRQNEKEYSYDNNPNPIIPKARGIQAPAVVRDVKIDTIVK